RDAEALNAQIVNRMRTVDVPARKLYERLIRPLGPYLAGAHGLCIAPDGAIWGVPFQALVSETKGRPRYLLERWPITYSPSVSALAWLVSNHHKPGGGLKAA